MDRTFPMRALPRPWLPPAALLGCVLHLGCAPADRRADCAPVSGTGCDEGERCVVDALGSPRCVSAAPTAEAGAACTSPEACPEGFGCVAVEARPACLPFCPPAAPAGVAACSAWRDGARCVGVVDGHPEIGVCVPPCDDPAAVDTACAPGGAASACIVPAGLDFAVCSGVPATAGRDAPCGPDARCPKGDVCLPAGDGARCRAAAPCEVGTFEETHPDAPRVAACAPCRLIAGPTAGDGPDVRYAICAAATDVAGAADLCLREGGRLAEADGSGVGDWTEAALEHVAAPVIFAGGCRDATGSVACTEGHPLCRLETAGLAGSVEP
jgi:hypothetical protein